MIHTLIEILSILVVFLCVRYLSHKATYNGWMPSWLSYKPFTCDTCLTFWSLLAIYASMGLVLGWWTAAIGGMVLAVLNAIAMVVDQRDKTVKVED